MWRAPQKDSIPLTSLAPTLEIDVDGIVGQVVRTESAVKPVDGDRVLLRRRCCDV